MQYFFAEKIKEINFMDIFSVGKNLKTTRFLYGVQKTNTNNLPPSPTLLFRPPPEREFFLYEQSFSPCLDLKQHSNIHANQFPSQTEKTDGGIINFVIKKTFFKIQSDIQRPSPTNEILSIRNKKLL